VRVTQSDVAPDEVAISVGGEHFSLSLEAARLIWVEALN
jgi:hypothetical protein